MKRTNGWIIALALAALSLADRASAQSGLPEAESEALFTVDAYLSARLAGDTDSLRNYLPPSMSEDEPTTLPELDPGDAQEKYIGAYHEIVSSEQMNEAEAQVDALITLGNGEVVNARFLLRKVDDRYVIVSEM